jgi:hypothetical protein
MARAQKDRLQIWTKEEVSSTWIPSFVAYIGHVITAKRRLTQVKDFISSGSSTRRNMFSMASVGSTRMQD